MPEVSIKDHLGDVWELLIPAAFKTSRRGLTEMRVYVKRGPLKRYQQIPLPVFTEWWPE